MYKMSRKLHFCWTLNNYTEEELNQLEEIGLKDNIKYMIVGKEVGQQGTPHIQGVTSWKNAKTLKAMIKSMPIRVANIVIANGTAFQNYEYCSKDKNFKEYGIRPTRDEQGKRNDLIEIKKKIANNEKIKTMLVNNDIVNDQQLRYAERLTKYLEKQRTQKPIVKWYYGATGTGKTKGAFEEFQAQANDNDNIYFSMDTGKWWEGYDAQEFVIIDDMRGDFMEFHQLLKLLDRYPYKVETKGSTRQFLATHIIITSAYTPQEMFSSREDIGQLLRRIDEIKQFGISESTASGYNLKH